MFSIKVYCIRGLGGAYEKPPALESKAEGGYYNQQAGLVITSTTPSGSGINNRTFYNNAEERREHVKELDMSVLDYPPNGLIYANTPIRLINAHKLKAPLMIVSNSNIYTIGDVNKEFGDKEAFDSGTSTKQPLALMSTQRIYHLSASWQDNQNQNRTTSLNQAAKPPLYAGDTANVVEINAALLDGSILVDEINFVKQHGGQSNPFYTETHSSGVNAWPNSDDLLERWGNGVTLKKRGSIIHLENPNMAEFDNSDAGPRVTAWVRRTHYSPPHRDYGYDPMFSDPTRLPPFSPLVSRQNYWNEVN